MSLRDLLTLNLFLQFTDASYRIRLSRSGRQRQNPVVVAAILNWRMIEGLVYNKMLACLLLLLIFALRRSHFLAKRALIVTASVYVCAIIVSL
jgi:hypothetical protein